MAQSTRHRQQQPLDVLQSMINGVLLETGKVLHAANKKGLSTLGHTNVRIQAFIPSANDKFHLALDELESDIARARAVIYRDLTEIRARQKAIDNPIPEPAEPAPSIQESMMKVEEDNIAMSGTEDSFGLANISAQEKSDSDIRPPDNVTATEGADDSVISTTFSTPHDLGGTENPELILDEEAADDSKVAEKQLDEELSDKRQSAGMQDARLPAAEPTESNDPTMPESDVDMHTTSAGEGDGSAPADAQDIDFGSIFGDDANNADASLNFDDMLFSADANDGQNVDFGEHADMDLSSFGDQANASNADVTAMIESLVGFGPASTDDFSVMDMSADANSNQTQPPQQADATTVQEDFGMNGGDLDMALGLDNNESTFDDLLDGIDFGDGADDGVGNDTMQHGEFDEAFFSVD